MNCKINVFSKFLFFTQSEEQKVYERSKKINTSFSVATSFLERKCVHELLCVRV